MKNVILLPVLVIAGFLLCRPVTCYAGFGDLGPYFSYSYGDGGLPSNLYSTAGQTTSPDGQSVTLYGNAGPINGADFADGFCLYWTGNFGGPINPGDNYTVNLNFDVSVTGGNLSWSYYSELWSNEGYEGSTISPSLAPMPASGQMSDVQLESPAFTQVGQTGQFQGYLNVEWSGYSPTDIFSINVNSINVTYEPAPEPDSSLLIITALLFGAIWRLGRRLRRWQKA